MSRRWLIGWLLWLCCGVAPADGLYFSKRPVILQQTDQLAVIDLTETRADVAMYIAIDGIPAGEEITYILPFWYPPKDFRLDEMTAEDFRMGYAVPAFAKVQRMNTVASGRVSDALATAALTLGIGNLPRWDGFGGTRKASTTAAPAAAGRLQPYVVQETPHARAELYRIGKTDLQQLIAQSGLPAKYLEPLKQYTTPHFAVMRLIGPAKRKSGATAAIPGATAATPGATAATPGATAATPGICYRFSHPLAKPGEYLYPLGTGASWPKPITVTEVYLTCADDRYLAVKAPKLPAYRWSAARHYDFIEEPFMSSALETAARPSAWHVAYFHSNPSEDIRATLHPRPAAWRLAVVEYLQRQQGIASVFAWLALLIGWLIAGKVLLRPEQPSQTEPSPEAPYAHGVLFVVYWGAVVALCLVGYLKLLEAMPWFLDAFAHLGDGAMLFGALVSALAVSMLFLVCRAIFSGLRAVSRKLAHLPLGSIGARLERTPILLTLRAMLVAHFWLLLILLGLSIGAGILRIPVSRLGGDPATISWSVWLLLGACTVAGIAVKRTAVRQFLRTNRTLHCWLLATAIYAVLTGGLYIFVRWCEAAVG